MASETRISSVHPCRMQKCLQKSARRGTYDPMVRRTKNVAISSSLLVANHQPVETLVQYYKTQLLTVMNMFKVSLPHTFQGRKHRPWCRMPILSYTTRESARDSVLAPFLWRVSCLKSGIVSCSCPAFGRNNLCRYSLVVALQQRCVDKMMSQFSGRSLTRLSTSSAPKIVGAKGALRERGPSFVMPNSESIA